MTIQVSKNGPKQQEGIEAEPFKRMVMIMGFSILATAGVYFGALYLITH
jgi:hypothetical protein